jgi:hypothetical protein
MNVRVFLHSLQHLLLVVAFRPHNSSPANAAMMPAPSRVEWHVSGREEWRAVSVYISIHVRVLLGDEVRVLLLVHVGVSTGNVRQLCSFYCPSTRVGGSLFVPCSREGQAKSRVCQSVQYGRFDNLLILPPFERKRFDNLASYRNPSGPIVSVSGPRHLSARDEYRVIGVGRGSLSLKSLPKNGPLCWSLCG